MVGLAGSIVFIGYTLMAYGWSQIRGSNAGLFDITWPGRFKGANPDTAAASSGGGGGNSATAQTQSGAVSQQESQTGTTPLKVIRNPDGSYTSVGSGVSP